MGIEKQPGSAETDLIKVYAEGSGRHGFLSVEKYEIMTDAGLFRLSQPTGATERTRSDAGFRRWKFLAGKANER